MCPWCCGHSSRRGARHRDTLGEASTLAPPHRDTHGHSWVIHGHSRNTHGVSWDTHGLSWDTLAILGSTASTPAPLGVGVPMVRPQHKPHHPRDSLESHRDTWEWGGRPPSPIVLSGVFGSPPYAAPLRDFQDTLLFWKTTRPLGALAAAVVPKDLAASNGHNFVVRAPILLSDHSIGIYFLRRCRWTPHLLHFEQVSTELRPSKESGLPGVTPWGVLSPQPQHSHSWALSLGSAPIQNSITSCPHLRLRCSWAF